MLRERFGVKRASVRGGRPAPLDTAARPTDARSPRPVPGGVGVREAKGLRKEGWKVNNKRIQRLWREEGLKVPYRKRKKRLAGVGITFSSAAY